MRRGFFFSADAMIACFSLLVCVAFFFSFVSGEYLSASDAVVADEKLMFASSLSEAIVKNRNPIFPENGSAFFDSAKKRTLPNVLDEGLLKKIPPVFFGEYFFAGMYERTDSAVLYYFREPGNGCVSFERFVIIRGLYERKAVFGVVVCD